MEHFYHEIGEDWFDYQSLYSQMVDRFDQGSFVEVGSWKGRSASFLGVEIINSGKNISLFCVDTWEGSVEHQGMECVVTDSLHTQFLANTDPIKSILTPIRKSSSEASALFTDNSVEFVFIDASHEYESVLEDLEKWYPKLKVGGVIAGHDYYPSGEHWIGVFRAVSEWSSKMGIEVAASGSCWVVNKIDQKPLSIPS
jgi:cephalosporin hydroxylase